MSEPEARGPEEHDNIALRRARFMLVF
jgi:hypothetical protein